MSVCTIPHMGKSTEDAYQQALGMLNASRVARETGRSLRSLQSYGDGSRRVTEPAARELLDYLRRQSAELTEAADALQAALISEEGDE